MNVAQRLSQNRIFEIFCKNSGFSVFFLMRCIVFLILFATPLFAFGQDSSLDSLPQAVRETVDMEKGDGVATKAETFNWGAVTIYNVEIDFDHVPTLELQIADNGKLIRVDRLQPEKEKDDGNDADD
jgi:hypothetical protein